VSEASSNRSKRLASLVRWGFPLVTVSVAVASQILVPRILQMRLSDGEYVAYVAVMAIAAYLGLADGGLLVSIMREMSAAHGSGDQATFLAEARRAKKVFTVTALVGVVIGAVGIGSALTAAGSSWSGASDGWFRWSAAAVLLSICFTIGFGSFHTAMCYSTGRLLTGQIAGLVTQALPTFGLIVALVVSRNLAVGLFVFAGTMATSAVVRGIHGVVLLRAESEGHQPGTPVNSIGHVVGAGIMLKAADVLPNSAFPHLLAVMAPSEVPAAIPARTFANSTRLAMQLVINLLSTHITRRMANAADRERGIDEYRSAARCITGAHLLQLGVAAALVVPVFRLWLPLRADEVSAFLPGMLAEQALLAVALPSSVLFAATDRLRLLGGVRVVGVVAGLAAFVLLLPHARAAAFGIGLCVSAVPHFVLGCYAEMRPLEGFPPRSRGNAIRYGSCLVAAVSAIFFLQAPFVVAGVIVLCGLLLLPGGLLQLRQLYRSANFDSAS